MRKSWLGLLGAVGLALTACIREEAPNAEADILSCVVPGDVLRAHPEISNETVLLYVRSEAEVEALAPEFTLTEGATIVPASGTTRDFSRPQVYTVTSEDGLWEKNYTVRCVLSSVGTYYDFERVRMEPRNGRFQIFYDLFSGDPVWVKSLGKRGVFVGANPRGEAQIALGKITVKIKKGDYYKVRK